MSTAPLPLASAALEPEDTAQTDPDDSSLGVLASASAVLLCNRMRRSGQQSSMARRTSALHSNR